MLQAANARGTALVQIVVDHVARALFDLRRLRTSKHQTLPHVPVGLESQQARVVQLLAEKGKNHIVLLHGMGAIGKTTLAKAVFNELHERDRTVPCHFLELSPEIKDAKALLPKQRELLLHLAFERALAPTDSDHARRLIASKLEGRKVLLVVDNVWGDQLKWLLPGNIMAVLGEGSVVLVTSQDQDVVKQLLAVHAAGGDAASGRWAEVEVDCLPAPAAMELVWRYFTTGGSPPEGGAEAMAAEVCRKAFGNDSREGMSKLEELLARCGGLPMAVELVAKHVAGLGHGARQEFFENLEGSLQDVYHAGGLFDRLAPSWNALSAANQEALLDIVWFLQGRCWGLMACYCSFGVLAALQKLSLIRAQASHGADCKSEQLAVTVHPVLAAFCKSRTRGGDQRRWAWSLREGEDERRASEYLKQISVRSYVFIVALHWHGPPVLACADRRSTAGGSVKRQLSCSWLTLCFVHAGPRRGGDVAAGLPGGRTLLQRAQGAPEGAAHGARHAAESPAPQLRRHAVAGRRSHRVAGAEPAAADTAPGVHPPCKSATVPTVLDWTCPKLPPCNVLAV
jgi:hypothetical protein